MNKDKLILKKLESLSRSKFRSSFSLREKDYIYIKELGLEKIKQHAYDFVNLRLAPAIISNDGKQTPMKGHPVFIAQHACACCCRGCLSKWHHIPEGRGLTNNEINFIVTLIMTWIVKEIKQHGRI